MFYTPRSGSRDSTENVQNENGGKIIYFECKQYQRRENNVDTAWASLTQMQHFFIRHDNGRNRFAVVLVNEGKIPIFRWVFDRISILLNFRRKCRKICQQNTADRDKSQFDAFLDAARAGKSRIWSISDQVTRHLETDAMFEKMGEKKIGNFQSRFKCPNSMKLITLNARKWSTHLPLYFNYNSINNTLLISTLIFITISPAQVLCLVTSTSR